MSEEQYNHDYQRWLRVNAFMRELHRQHYVTQLEQELDRLDEIDMIVDCMDSYPEVEEILERLWEN